MKSPEPPWSTRDKEEHTLNWGAALTLVKVPFFLLALGSGGMALLADSQGPWVFGVLPAIAVLGTLMVVVSRSRKMRAAMRSVDEELQESPAARED